MNGRAAREVEFEVLGGLSTEDLAVLEVEERPAGQAPAVRRISDRHHALARALAGGMTETEAAVCVGLSINRVSILKDDATFKELVAFYKEKVDAAYVGMHETLAGISLDAAILLRERMEDEPEKLSVTQLVELTKLGADRTGHGPSQKQDVNVNVQLGARLDAARERIAKRRAEDAKMITLEATPVVDT